MYFTYLCAYKCGFYSNLERNRDIHILPFLVHDLGVKCYVNFRQEKHNTACKTTVYREVLHKEREYHIANRGIMDAVNQFNASKSL